MKKINFAFGIHCHQPVGNFDFVFDEAYHKAYQPFLDVAEKFPEFKLNIHYTGILLEWIRTHYPGHIRQLKKMGESGQVEHLSGGFYEPILSVIPEEDRIGQIRKQSRWVKDHLKQEPKGMWLAERVWEPGLPSTLHKAGMRYSVIDDAHFKYSGLHDEDLLGYYITEDTGYPLRIFPISQKLRYTIPFQDPQETLNYLREIASEAEDRLIVFADDGEKFGVWPGTHDLVFRRGWLENFFHLIQENRSWINVLHFSEAINRLKPLGRVYLPTASYAEMMQWSLPSDAFRKYEEFEHYLKEHQVYNQYAVFVRGGFWRNFLAKYPESNQMHKRMLYLSRKAWSLKQKSDNPLIDQALDHIWAGQCNCPYWHGVFGGLYLGHIRHAIYHELITADKLLRKVEGTENKLNLVETDYNQDGYQEVLLETPNLNLCIEPAKGGRICELDYLPANFNLLNTLTRREEGYHHKLWEMAQAKENTGSDREQVASIHDLVTSKEEGLEKYLHYDFYERKSLIDHFLADDTTIEKFQAVDYAEVGDFVNGEYQLAKKTRQRDALIIELMREGKVKYADQEVPLRIAKQIRVPRENSEISVSYRLQTDSPAKVPLWFGVEFNFGMLAGYTDDRYYFCDDEILPRRNLASRGEINQKNHLGIVDEYNNIRVDLRSDVAAKIWRFPIETISLSEGGFERVYQSSTILFSYRIELNKKWNVLLQMKISGFKK